MGDINEGVPEAARPARPPDCPSNEDVLRAIQAGFDSIDEGRGFDAGFSRSLIAAGYRRRPDAPCTCPDRGAHGHLPECRWLRA